MSHGALHVPEHFNFARDVFDVHARHPGRLAMLWIDEAGARRRVTFGEFSERSTALAAGLQKLGVQRGQTVLLILPRLVEWWETMLACLRAGIVVAPGTTQLTARDLASRLAPSEAVAIVTDESGVAKVDEALALAPRPAGAALLRLVVRPTVGGQLPRPGWQTYEKVLAAGAGAASVASSPPGAAAARAALPSGWLGRGADTLASDRALLYFTSGTTGAPKMALHTQASYGIGHALTARWWLGLRDTDLHWNLSDTGWAKAAWSSFFAPWIAGSAVFVHYAPRFEPRRTLEILARHPITTLCGAPTNYRLLIQQDFAGLRFPALRSCTAAGEPLNAEVLATWKRFTGLDIRDGYGQTETVLCIGHAAGEAPKPGCMGVAAPGFDVAVLQTGSHEDPAAASPLREAPVGEEGEIAIRVRPERPVGLFAGYWKDEALNARAFRGDWYLTGDRASRDAQGRFWFVGRGDDVIKSSGYRIGPFEVESALLEHPGVAESAVVGKPDATRGQIVKAFVVLAEGWEGDAAFVQELQDFVQQRTAPYKYPREIEFVAELPKTVSGKIRRVDLRRHGAPPS
ncbi:MAG: AMP-binding protein [Planctomycetota bacterium]